MIELPASEQPRASILICAASEPELLRRTLVALAAELERSAVPAETVVLLNAAQPEVAGLVREAVAGARVVASDVNLGLAGGTNRARRAARGELLVLLHDDAEVQPGWLDTLVACADAHPQAGAIAARALDPAGQVQTAGCVLWSDATTTMLSDDARAEPHPVDYGGSFSLLVRAMDFDAAGGCDERLHPAYFVDVDLSLALRVRGRAVLHEPRAEVIHHRGGARDPELRGFMSDRNRPVFVAKWAAELARQEPPAAGDPEAVERALARAAAYRPQAAPPPREPPWSDADYLRADAELMTAFAEHMRAEAETARADRDRFHEELLAARAEAADLRAQLDAR